MTIEELKKAANEVANNLREWAYEDFELTSDDFENEDELERIEETLQRIALAFGMVL